MKETTMCLIDREGKVMLETAVTTDSDAIFKALRPYVAKLSRVGHEAGSLSPPWLQNDASASWPCRPAPCFKDYTSFCVQDLILQPHVVDFRSERWVTQDGTVAPLDPVAGQH
jgi:hypothetical protein